MSLAWKTSCLPNKTWLTTDRDWHKSIKMYFHSVSSCVLCNHTKSRLIFLVFYWPLCVPREHPRARGIEPVFNTFCWRNQGVMKLHLANTSTMWVGKLILNSISVSLETVKNCHRRLYCKSSLAGYWVKFSTSNNRASVRPHRLRYCRCAKITIEWLTEFVCFSLQPLGQGYVMPTFLNIWSSALV